MMNHKRILVAMDSFKGTLSAVEACAVVAQTAREHAEARELPIADGGAGTVEAILRAVGGRKHSAHVVGPRGDVLTATFGTINHGETAVLEMASASGLELVPRKQRNPWHTTSRGTGMLLLEALRGGARRIILGIGDSATVDGGLGMIQGLGAFFLDERGEPVGGNMTGGTLREIAAVDLDHIEPLVGGAEFEVLCDVSNPLLGHRGAAAVFGPQKGATPAMVEKLEAGLRHAYDVIEKQLNVRVREEPGAGAAGGLGAAAMAFLGARLVPGSKRVLDLYGFDRALEQADLVVTGEGSLDSQSLGGKGPAEVVRRARAKGVPCAVIAGRLEDAERVKEELGLRECVALRERGAGDPSPEQAKAELRRAAKKLVADFHLT